MAVGSRAMDRMNRVRPPTCPYGPWTVARWTGTPSSGPVHGPGVVRVAVPAWAFAWTTYVLLQCLFDRFGSVFPQCGLMVFPGVVIVSR